MAVLDMSPREIRQRAQYAQGLLASVIRLTGIVANEWPNGSDPADPLMKTLECAIAMMGRVSARMAAIREEWGDENDGIAWESEFDPERNPN